MKQKCFSACSKYICVAILFFLPLIVNGQQSILVNLAPIDGMPITPDNIFNYQIQSSGAGTVQIRGSITFRNSNLSFSYTTSCTLRQGINTLEADDVHPQWQFSSSALQNLFFNYKMLPAGTFEYCVTVTPVKGLKESAKGGFEECLYHRTDDMFLINLIDPENKAKLKEYNPLLSWIATYSFSNELTYRLRVAEIQQGQNPVNAVLRNQPVFDESNLSQNSIIYPDYAKPLVANQPYAWAVDAYFKGILLGSSETWQFIIPDSLPPIVKAARSYIDIKRETGVNRLYAVGTMKLKYILDDSKKDSLSLELFDDKNKKCAIKPAHLNALYGDNRYELNMQDSCNLKHQAYYILKITTKTKHEYTLPFQYLNPEYLH